jgi:hypothetical protein
MCCWRQSVGSYAMFALCCTCTCIKYALLALHFSNQNQSRIPKGCTTIVTMKLRELTPIHSIQTGPFQSKDQAKVSFEGHACLFGCFSTCTTEAVIEWREISQYTSDCRTPERDHRICAIPGQCPMSILHAHKQSTSDNTGVKANDVCIHGHREIENRQKASGTSTKSVS